MASNPIKKLAGETVVYGLSSIVPKFLNYLLVPFHTIVAFRQPAQYGVITELYTYVTFLIIILTYGMETGFFKFHRNENDRDNVFGTAFTSLVITSLLFFFVVFFSSSAIAGWLDYSEHSEYIRIFAAILALDAIAAIPFAGLRQKVKPWKFASIKILNVVVSIILNLFFLWFCPKYADNGLISRIYNPQEGVLYVFLANLAASAVTLLLLLPEIFSYKFRFRMELLKRMLVYSIPLMIAGLAGNVNEAIDRVLLRRMLPEGVDQLQQLGIYGSNLKIAVLMVLFIQMFRYAAEPFFFAQSQDRSSKELIARVMKYFVLFGLLIFLGITFGLDLIKYFEGETYWEGLAVVPILLLANLMLGVYYNLSIWFKLNGMTYFGILIAGMGAAISIVLNILFIPQYGYYASAWTHLITYCCMTVLTLALGAKYYPIPYEKGRILLYIIVAVGLFFLGTGIHPESVAALVLLRASLFAAFLGFVYVREGGRRFIDTLTKR